MSRKIRASRHPGIQASRHPGICARVDRAVSITVEALEMRRLLSTWTVTSTGSDDSSGTLLWAVEQANAATDTNEKIVFDPSLTANGPIIIYASIEINSQLGSNVNPFDPAPVDIEGPGSDLLTIDGSITNDFLNTLTVSGITVQGGI